MGMGGRRKKNLSSLPMCLAKAGDIRSLIDTFEMIFLSFISRQKKKNEAALAVGHTLSEYEAEQHSGRARWRI